jgi:hypothetical protein
MQVIHTLEGAAQLVELTYSRNRNSRASAMFRKLRRMREWQMFGDYPLLATLFSKCDELGVPMNRGQIRRAIDQSPELRGLSRREKRILIEALERPRGTR